MSESFAEDYVDEPDVADVDVPADDAPEEGTVEVAAHRGFQVVFPKALGPDEDLVIRQEPVAVPADMAEELVARSNGRLFIVEDQEV